MALRRTLVIVGTLSLLTLSLLSSAYMTNLGTSVYCDYFSLDACKSVPSSSSPGNAAPSPPTIKNVPILPPVRNYSDAEMSAFVLAKDLLSRPPYPVEKAKIAFMFLTAGPLPFEFVWEKFFEVTSHLSFSCLSDIFFGIIAYGLYRQYGEMSPGTRIDEE